MTERTQLNVAVEPELLRRLKVVAAKKGTSVSRIVRDFVVWYVEKEEK